MAFRRTVPQEELRSKLTAEERARHETTYQASRGGHFPKPQRPTPGTPKKED